MNGVAFSIDETSYKFKVLFEKNKVLEYKEYDFSHDCISDWGADYDKILSQTLSKFVLQENIYPATVTCVLSDKDAFFDYLEVPALSGKKSSDMLNLEISTRFKRTDEYKTVSIPVSSQNGKSMFVVFMVRSDKIAAVHSALKAYKFSSPAVTIESAMIANSLLTINPQDKRGSFLYVSVLGNETKLTVVKDSKLIGYGSIPYGKDLCDLQTPLKSAPPVLPTESYYTENKTAFDCADVGDYKGNKKYLLRVVSEMSDILANKYNLKDIAVKYIEPYKNTALFPEQKALAKISVSAPIPKNLQLYGALTPKIFDKGLIF